jgi:acetyl-CoA C-acetyltransferase
MATPSRLDLATPVLVGVGQASERLDEAGYEHRSPVELAAAAAREAILDAHGDDAAIATAIDTIAGVRQFEISTPRAVAPLGRSTNFPRSVATRLGGQPRRAILEVGGGQSPLHLVTEFAAEIARGRCEVALVVGAEAISTTRHFSDRDDRPSFAEDIDGDLEDRGFGLDGLILSELSRHRVTGAPPQYALLENARRAALGVSRERYAISMGTLFAPFSTVAAGNPHAAARTVRSAEELVTPTARNRLIAEPYTRYIVARDQVNQGAAVLVTSVGGASRLGIPQDRWVFIHGHGALRDRPLLERADLARSPAATLAVEHALVQARRTVEDLLTIDLYSCFPIAVFAVCDGIGLRADDPRGLTTTGGLPFFGGPGNNYSSHAIAETVRALRRSHGSFGLVGANGGTLNKYSAAVLSTTPTPWRADRSEEVQATLDRGARVEAVSDPQGWGVVETYTVRHVRDERVGVIVGRQRDGRRFVAMAGDERGLELLGREQPVGAEVLVRSGPQANHFVLDGRSVPRLDR